MRLLIYTIFTVCVAMVNAAAKPREEEEPELETLRPESFPEDFRFAVATASYQIEGGWNADGKGENIWDRLTHENPDKVVDRSNGDVACDSYNKYEEDIRMIKDLGVQVYRFSLSWSRILPTGFKNIINEPGLEYYDKLIDGLLAEGIEPMVTMFHWDLPQPLQEIGGWTNERVVAAYKDYADVVFERYQSKVKLWITINEPRQICKMGYGDGWIAPAKITPGLGDYMCVKNVLRAHAEGYHLYKDKYNREDAQIGIAIDSFWYEPDTEADKEAAERVFDFYTGIYSEPVFGSGNLPQRVIDSVAERSAKQGFVPSRLELFTDEEAARIKGTSDFFALNYYTAVMVREANEPDLTIVSWDSDMKAEYFWKDEWEAASSWWLRVTPWMLPKLLKSLGERYGNLPIYITENGLSDHENTEDHQRANYYLRHLSACLEAIHDHKVNLKMYTAWSLMDNFEWTHGYTNRFGLYHVDFNDPDRKRTPKLSAEIYKDIVSKRHLPEKTLAYPDGGGSQAVKSSHVLIVSLCIIPYVILTR